MPNMIRTIPALQALFQTQSPEETNGDYDEFDTIDRIGG